MSSTPELPELPDWLKSMGLPKVANEATDRYAKPIWDEIRSELELLPDHRGRLPRAGFRRPRADVEAIEELARGEQWLGSFEAMWPAYGSSHSRSSPRASPYSPAASLAVDGRMRGGDRKESLAETVTELVPRRDVPRHLNM